MHTNLHVECNYAHSSKCWRDIFCVHFHIHTPDIESPHALSRRLQIEFTHTHRALPPLDENTKLANRKKNALNWNRLLKNRIATIADGLRYTNSRHSFCYSALCSECANAQAIDIHWRDFFFPSLFLFWNGVYRQFEWILNSHFCLILIRMWWMAMLTHLIQTHFDHRPCAHVHLYRIHSSNGRDWNGLSYRRIYSDRGYFQRRRLAFGSHLCLYLVLPLRLLHGLNQPAESMDTNWLKILSYFLFFNYCFWIFCVC